MSLLFLLVHSPAVSHQSQWCRSGPAGASVWGTWSPGTRCQLSGVPPSPTWHSSSPFLLSLLPLFFSLLFPLWSYITGLSRNTLFNPSASHRLTLFLPLPEAVSVTHHSLSVTFFSDSPFSSSPSACLIDCLFFLMWVICRTPVALTGLFPQLRAGCDGPTPPLTSAASEEREKSPQKSQDRHINPQEIQSHGEEAQILSHRVNRLFTKACSRFGIPPVFIPVVRNNNKKMSTFHKEVHHKNPPQIKWLMYSSAASFFTASLHLTPYFPLINLWTPEVAEKSCISLIIKKKELDTRPETHPVTAQHSFK